ncbi:MAG: flagellar motor protein MotB [Sterolibacterium sp.]|nr:flagellar motor protein MotB [Sterolibacterium sp.]
MIGSGLRRSPTRGSRDQAEKPFWISFSDLMTALMVLFMVAMAAAIMVITQEAHRLEQQKLERDDTLKSCMNQIAALAAQKSYTGVAVHGNSIEFGSIAEFSRNGHNLPEDRKDVIRRLMAGVLEIARSGKCSPWIKNIVVDGYASQEGSYLLNLNLSLQRSQRMLCVLLDSKANTSLSEADRKFVRKKFLVGGASFNSVKERPEDSRRVEFRIDFREYGEKLAEIVEIPWDDDAKCPIDKP